MRSPHRPTLERDKFLSHFDLCGRRASTPKRKPASAFVEALECRRLLTVSVTYTVTNVHDSGAGSLRQAINKADGNNAKVHATIKFNIPGTGVHTIKPLTNLPTLTATNVMIDGSSQNDFEKQRATTPDIVLNGSVLSSLANGLTITGSNDVISHLETLDFTGDGILVAKSSHGDGIDSNVLSENNSGLVLDGASAVSVQGNRIGTNVAGIKRLDNSDGILLTNGAHNNTIGGTSSPDRNVISGNAEVGVHLEGSGTSNNVVAGNYIGVDATGNAPIYNPYDVLLESGANSNTIGLPSHGNVIGGGGGGGSFGIALSRVQSETIQGNFIGTNAAGTAPLGLSVGIYISGGDSHNLIGNTAPSGSVSATRNVISGNADGIIITDLDNEANHANTIAGNLIGTDVTGKHALGNPDCGILVECNLIADSAGGNTIGLPSDGNVISGNGDGIRLDYVQATTIQGNFIGTDITGKSKLPNTGNGISVIDGSTGNLIGNKTGGVTAGSANVISGNNVNGVFLSTINDVFLSKVTGNTIAGNRIGVNVSGKSALGNGGNGVFIAAGATGNTIGLPHNGNVISGNNTGIRIQNTSKNTVQGNFVGLDISGMFAIPNQVGLLLDGGATGNIIGVNSAGAKNDIAGNTIDGILLTDPGTKGNAVSFNIFGKNTIGHSVPNGVQDVLYTGGATV